MSRDEWFPPRCVRYEHTGERGAQARVGTLPSAIQVLGSSDLCANDETLAKLDRVLKRKKFNRYLDPEFRSAFAAMVRRNARVFEVRETDALAKRPVCRDANDNKFLALAIIAGTDAIVSSDEDLLVLHPWLGIPILSPADFLDAVHVDSAPTT